jgi:hypothetical protein
MNSKKGIFNRLIAITGVFLFAIVMALGLTGNFAEAQGKGAVKEAVVDPNTVFQYVTTSYSHNECIQDNGDGAQATLTTANSDNCAEFVTPRIGYIASCFDGYGCYQYEDEAGLCLKVDPNIAGYPIVFSTCATSGVTKEDEEFTDPHGSGDTVFNQYTGYFELTASGSNGDVSIDAASGLAWVI